MGSDKKPGNCNSIDEIRNEIDKLDKQIIQLFSKRHEFVREIVHYKTDEESVVAQSRKDKVINERASLAGDLGLDREIFKQIYTLLVESNINKELELLKLRKAQNQTIKTI